MNDNVKDIGNVSKVNKDSIVIWNLFNHTTHKFRKRPRSSKKRHRNQHRDIEQELMNIVSTYRTIGFINKLRVYILGLPRTCMGKLITIGNRLLMDDTVPPYVPLCILDLTHFRQHRSISDIEDTSAEIAPKHYIKVHYNNKGIDMINLPRILHSKKVTTSIPSFISNQTPPRVSFIYTKTIRNKIINSKKAVRELDLETNPSYTCNCNTSKYRDQYVGHVVTGNLGIVKNRKLRKLLHKGPSYREPCHINWKTNLDTLVNAIRLYKESWAKREQVDVRVLNEWEGVLVEAIKHRIGTIKCKHRKSKRRVRTQVLKQRTCLAYLKEFHKQYVMVPADKASNNIIFVCKQYYLNVIRDEVKQDTECTYLRYHETADTIIKKHVSFMRTIDIKVDTTMQKLPSFYWLPKMHKTPVGSRFIAASYSCTTKPLSRLLTKCLSLVLTHFQQYNAGITRRTGCSAYWVIDNSTQVIDMINTLNKSNSLKSFDSFDFATLYTSIPHTLLIKCISKLIEEAYKVRSSTFISVGYRSAFWSKSKVKHCSSITSDQLITYVEYLIDNIFISIGNHVFKQVIGIPMGTDCAPLLANLFLFHFEYSYIKEKLSKADYSMALSYKYTVRYIDDLLTFNNPSFEGNIATIYPPELTLKKTTESSNRLSYLDIDIRINNGHFNTSVYDKRDNFSFSVVRFPFLDGNIPAKPTYGVYISQLVRIGRICDSFKAFNARHTELTHRLMKQGFKYDKLCRKFKEFARKHNHLIKKFHVSIHKHIKQGISVPLKLSKKLARNVTVRRN